MCVINLGNRDCYFISALMPVDLRLGACWICPPALEAMTSTEKPSDAIQRLRRRLVTILCSDPDLLLVTLNSLLLITQEENSRLSEISNPDRKVRALLSTILQKGEASCCAFLSSLMNLQGLFPNLNQLTEDGSLPGWQVPVSPEAMEGKEENVGHPQTGNMKEEDVAQSTDSEKSFTQKRNSASPHRIHAGERSYSCTQCAKSFVRKGNLLNHQRIHTVEPPFSSKKCETSFNVEEKHLKHQIIHTQELQFSCTECEKSFNQKAQLKRHQKIHTDKGLKTLAQRLFSCTQCKKSFSVKTNLLKHLKSHTREMPFSCTDCEKCFNLKIRLKRHQIIHTKERHLFCSQCEKSFKRNEHLKRHQRIHTRERPFFCSQCKARFKRQEHLKRHQRIHTQERPFFCSQCKERFKRQEHLQRHQRIHTKERPFLCSHCNEGFNRPEHLQRHQRTHTERRACMQKPSLTLATLTQRGRRLKTLIQTPFLCTQCGESFSLKSALLVHKKAHKRRYYCTECEMSFSQKSHLKRHQNIHACGANNTDQGESSTESLHGEPAPDGEDMTDREKEDHEHLERESCLNWEERKNGHSAWGDISTQMQAENNLNQHTEEEGLAAPSANSRKVVLKAATFTFRSPVTVAPPLLVDETKKTRLPVPTFSSLSLP